MKEELKHSQEHMGKHEVLRSLLLDYKVGKTTFFSSEEVCTNSGHSNSQAKELESILAIKSRQVGRLQKEVKNLLRVGCVEFKMYRFNNNNQEQ